MRPACQGFHGGDPVRLDPIVVEGDDLEAVVEVFVVADRETVGRDDDAVVGLHEDLVRDRLDGDGLRFFEDLLNAHREADERLRERLVVWAYHEGQRHPVTDGEAAS